MTQPTAPTRSRIADRRLMPGPRVLRRLPEGVESAPYTLFELVPQGDLIGAEIRGCPARRAGRSRVVRRSREQK